MLAWIDCRPAVFSVALTLIATSPLYFEEYCFEAMLRGGIEKGDDCWEVTNAELS